MATAAGETATAVGAALDRLAPAGALGVAVSGGGDSMALLILASRWAFGRGRRLEAATVDHRLRPESATEAQAVAALCARLGVDVDLPLSNHNMHPQHRDVLSGAARATLERAFADDLDRFGYDW